MRTGPVCGSPGDALRLPRAPLAKGIPSAAGSPGSQAGSALPGSEGADGAGDEGKALLFVPIQKSAAFELLFPWPSVPLPSASSEALDEFIPSCSLVS